MKFEKEFFLHKKRRGINEKKGKYQNLKGGKEKNNKSEEKRHKNKFKKILFLNFVFLSKIYYLHFKIF